MITIYHIPILAIYLIIMIFVFYLNLKRKTISYLIVISLISFFLYFYYCSNLLPIPIGKDSIEFFKEFYRCEISFIPFSFFQKLLKASSTQEILLFFTKQLIFFLTLGFLFGYIYRNKNKKIKISTILIIPLVSTVLKITFSSILGYIYKNIYLDLIVVEILFISIGMYIFYFANKMYIRISYNKGTKGEIHEYN